MGVILALLLYCQRLPYLREEIYKTRQHYEYKALLFSYQFQCSVVFSGKFNIIICKSSLSAIIKNLPFTLLCKFLTVLKSFKQLIFFRWHFFFNKIQICKLLLKTLQNCGVTQQQSQSAQSNIRLFKL